MTTPPDWWRKPRPISVVVDNPSWILPFAEELVRLVNDGGDHALLCRDHDGISGGAVAFFLGCLKITLPHVLARNRRNLVVHESALPEGRGFSPLTWQIIGGRNRIPVCLLEAAEKADAGPVIYREALEFAGHELIGEMRERLGALTVALCRRFLAASAPPWGQEQEGEPNYYPRRRPADSRLDPDRPIAEQFNLLRIVDNDRYPAFFDFRGHRYVLRIDRTEERTPE